jgi:proline iminopeptidase
MENTGSLERDGFKLRYRTEGAGPDALVIGSSVYYSRSFSQNLRKFLRLHFVDYRGFAEGPEDDLTFEALLDDLECFRQKLGLQ